MGDNEYEESYRGKILKKTANARMTTSAYGLLQSSDPLYYENDLARMNEPQKFLKPSDQSNYDTKAGWVIDNFNRLVHPFSNSISGTMLCQLRALAYVYKSVKNNPQDAYSATQSIATLFSKEELRTFIAVFVSAFLFNSGGHSLHEFTAPLSITEVKKEFATINGFDTLDLEEIFLNHNKIAFDNAITKAIHYNNQIIKRKGVREEIEELKHHYDDNKVANFIKNSHPKISRNYKQLRI